jgi:SAM-dependent methyltransferase
MFYEVLAKYYDLVFPVGEATVSFLDRELGSRGVKKVLDLACGTGGYTVALAGLGYEAWGTDLEHGMVELAKKRALATGAKAGFKVGDMRDPGVPGISFDGLFCIGNSLAHLTGEGDLAGALQAMRGVLPGGGAAVFQIVNFDRILERGDTDLPLIEREGVRFTRTYRPRCEERLVFDSILEIRDDTGRTERYENSITLRPIRKALLEELLLQAGFKLLQTYGDFAYSPWSARSQAVVTVAEC